MFSVTLNCEGLETVGIFCFKKCGNSEINVLNECVERIDPEGNEVYSMFNGLKHKVRS